MYRKRGQGGVDIATLIFLIALFILIYVIMIPVEEREELLGESSLGEKAASSFGDEEYSEKKVLLSVSPGKVFDFEKETIEKEISPVALFNKVVEEYEDLVGYLDLGLTSKTLYFNAPDEKVESLELFFLIPKAGKLKIKFNGYVVFDGNIGAGDIPITLPVMYMKKINSLSFERSVFSDVKLSDLKLKLGKLMKNTKVVRSFVMTGSEKEGLKKAKLEFFLNCLSLKNTGRMKIKFNERLLRDDYIFCDALKHTIDINKDYVKEGTNVIEFEIDKGDYKLEDMKIILELEEIDYPKYDFEIGDEDYDDLDWGCGDRDCLEDCEDDCDKDCETFTCFDRCLDDCRGECEKECDRKVILDMVLGKDEKKKAAVTINEGQFTLNTNERRFRRDITSFVNRGANFIKIIPKADFEIENLKIYLTG